MTKEKTYRSRIKKCLIVGGLFLVFSYALWNGRSIILGPNIDILSPENGVTINSSLVNITGKALNTAFLSLNDREIFIDKSGYFSEYIALLPGSNVIKIKSRDRFGETEEKTLHLYFKGEN